MSKLDPLTALRRRISTADLDEYEAALDALGGVSAMSEIYDLADFVVEQVEGEFDCVHCVPGCSECCSQLPLVTFDEWRLIAGWMHENLTGQRRSQIVGNAESLLADRESVLPGWMRLGEVDLESAEAADIVGEMFDNESTTCPFLFDGRCSIYPVRPLVCRSYGRMMRTEDDSLYCQPYSRQDKRRSGRWSRRGASVVPSVSGSVVRPERRQALFHDLAGLGAQPSHRRRRHLEYARGLVCEPGLAGSRHQVGLRGSVRAGASGKPLDRELPSQDVSLGAGDG